MSVSLGSAVAFLELDTTKFQTGFKTALSGLKTFGDKTKSTEQRLKGLQSSLGTIGGGLTKSVTLPLAGLGTASLGVAANFESAMSQVAATMGMTAEEINNGSENFDRLEKAAKEAGATTQFSASQAAEALNYMALAGYDVDKSIETLPTVLNLAAAGGMDLATASDMVTDSMSALGDTAGTTESFVDKMAKTSQKSNTSVQQLGEAILTVGGTAKSLAGGVTEMNTVLGIFADNGVKSAEGGTALRNIILSLTAPTDKARGAMEDLGLSVLDAEGNMRPMNDIFNDLNDILSEMSQGEQTEVLNTIFNKTDLRSVNALLANSGERFNELSGYIDNSDGAASAMAETMQNNLNGALTTLKSALEGAAIEIGQRLIPYIQQLVKWINDVVTWFNNLSQSQLDMIVKIGAVVAAIGPLTLIISKVVGLVATVIGVITKVNSAIQFLSAMLGLASSAFLVIPVAIAGVVAAFVLMYNKCEWFRDGVNSAVDSIKEFLSGMADKFVELKDNIFDSISNVLSDIGEWVSNVKDKMSEGIENAINAVVEFFDNLPYKIGYALGKALRSIVDWCANVLSKVKTEVPKIITSVANFFQKLPSRIATFLSQAVQKVSSWASQTASKAKDGASKTLNNIITYVKQIPTKVKQWFDKTITAITSWGTKFVSKAKEGASKAGTTITTTLQQLPSKVMSIGGNIVSGLWNGISDKIGWMKEKVSSFAQGIIDGMKGKLRIQSPSKVAEKEVGVQIAQGVINGVDKKKKDAVKSAEELVLSYIDTAQQKANTLVSSGKLTQAGLVGYWREVYNKSKETLGNLTKEYKKTIKELNKEESKLAKHSEGWEKVNKAYTEQIDALKKTQEGQKKQVEALKKVQDARQKELSGLKKNTDAYKKAKQGVDSAKEAVKKAQEEYKKTTELIKKQNQELSKEKKSYNESTKGIKDRIKTLQSEAKEQEKVQKAIEKANQNRLKAQEKLNKELSKLDKQYAKDWKAVKSGLIKDIQSVTDEYDKAIESRQKAILGGTKLFEEFTASEAISKDKLITNLESQVNALNVWKETLDSLGERKGVAESGLLEELQDMGQDSVLTLRQINAMSDEELEKYIELYKEKKKIALERSEEENKALKEQTEQQIKDLIDNANKELNALEKQYNKDLEKLGISTADTSEEIGKNIVKGLIKGIKSENANLQATLQTTFKSVESTAANALEIHSPSRKMERLGKFTGQGYLKGFVTSFKDVYKTITQSFDNATNKASEIMEGFADTSSKWLENVSDSFGALSESMEGFMDLAKDTAKASMVSLMPSKQREEDTAGGGTVRSDEQTATGDTYNFYSVKSTPYEYAREMRKTKRELLEGF